MHLYEASIRLGARCQKIKSCSITPKRVTSGGIDLRDLSPGQHSSEQTSQRRRAVGDTVSDLTDSGIEPKHPAPIAMWLTELASGHARCCG